ncbi:PepSY domain-containing protein [Novosphingobium sp. MW5]|nr:PepSY domain-containing protein [Novosphingobium sp. MW5]
MTNGFRSKLLWMHTWTGITVGIAMLLFAVTGTLLAIRAPIDDVLMSAMTRTAPCSQPLPVQVLVDSARAQVPSSKPKAIEIRNDPAASIAVEFANDDYVYLDACSGRALGVQNEYGGVTGTMDWLHRFHFLENGRLVAGVFNLAILLAIVIGGLILWWPRSRASLRAGLTYNRNLPRTARLLSLHRAAGAYAVILLLLLTITALPISFDWAKSILASVTSSSVAAPKAPKNEAKGSGKVSLDDLRSQIAAEMPGASKVTINLPKKAGDSIRVEVIEAGAPHVQAKSYLYFDAVSGKVLKRIPYATDLPLGRKVYLYFLVLHMGLVGGLPYQLALMLCSLLVPVQYYSGVVAYFRRRPKAREATLPLRLVSRHQETPSIVVLEFEHAKGGPLPPFSAGAHIDLHLDGGIIRQYSLCNPPGETHRYVIAVQRAEQSRGGSRLIHETCPEGTILQASLPRNHFELVHEAQESLLVAGGIGITPILCMAERLAATSSQFTLHYCFRHPSEAAFLERLSASSFASKVVLHESAAGNRLDIGAMLDALPRTTQIYVCGPNSLNDSLFEEARAKGWAEDHLHREYFVASQFDTSADRPFEICVASTGAVIEVAADQTALDALLQHGFDIPSSCSQGTCGTCLTRVLEGEVEHRDMLFSNEERARNDQFTPCCSRARSDKLILDL